MDDPIFDPWGAALGDDKAGEVAPVSPPRWRSQIRPGPTPPPRPAPAPRPASPRPTPPVPADTPQPAQSSAVSPPPRAPVQPTDLTGTAGLLRTIAAPRLQELARRLQMARHEARVEDTLGGPTAALRLILHPWRGPWTDELSPPRGMLELALEDGLHGPVAVRIWLDPAADEPAEEMSLAPDELGPAWIEGHALHFVERLLARA